MEYFLLDNLFWLLLAMVSAGGLIWTFKRGGKINLSPQSAILTVNRGGGVFLDVRPPTDYTGGNIPNSQNVPLDEIAARLPGLAKFKKKPVVLVCANGISARKLIPQLQKDGFEQVFLLTGGIAGWREANLPLLNKNRKGGKGK